MSYRGQDSRPALGSSGEGSSSSSGALFSNASWQGPAWKKSYIPKKARTNRLIVLNITDLTVEWWELKQFIGHTLGIWPLHVNIVWGWHRNMANVEFDTPEEAQSCIDLFQDGSVTFRGMRLHFRQDREDSALQVCCSVCDRARRCTLTGEWQWNDAWLCTSCTVNDLQQDLQAQGRLLSVGPPKMLSKKLHPYSPLQHDLQDFPIVDCHLHLEYILDGTACYMKDATIEDAIADLALRGPFAVVTSCCDLKNIENTLRLVKNGNGHVYASFGGHPKNSLWEWDKDMQSMLVEAVGRCREISKDSVVAWGECGLDYAGYDDPSVDPAYVADCKVRQKQILLENIRMGEEFGLPLQFHSRDCENDFLDMLKKHLPNRDYFFHWHACVASVAAVKIVLDTFPNAYFGIAGGIVFPYAYEWELPNQVAEAQPPRTHVNLHEMVAAIPLHRMLLETDAPHFTSRTGGPADTLEIAAWVAWIKELDVKTVIDACAKNAFDLYGVVAKPVERKVGGEKMKKPSRMDILLWKREKAKAAGTGRSTGASLGATSAGGLSAASAVGIGPRNGRSKETAPIIAAAMSSTSSSSASTSSSTSAEVGKEQLQAGLEDVGEKQKRRQEKPRFSMDAWRDSSATEEESSVDAAHERAAFLAHLMDDIGDFDVFGGDDSREQQDGKKPSLSPPSSTCLPFSAALSGRGAQSQGGETSLRVAHERDKMQDDGNITPRTTAALRSNPFRTKNNRPLAVPLPSVDPMRAAPTGGA